MSDRERNIEIVREFIAAVNAADYGTMRRLAVADGFVNRLPFRPEGVPETVEGIETFIQFVQAWGEQIEGSENLTLEELDTLAGDPDRVYSTYSSDMTLVSGEKYGNSYLTMWRLRDGRIEEMVGRLDSIPLLLAMGGEVKNPLIDIDV